LYDLPEGATPVDFAFAIHTEVGLRAHGARVNGKIAPLDRPLENRDVVEIMTRKTASPNRQWLNFVKTAGARSRIKAWFRASSREANVATGRQLLESHLATWGFKRVDEVPSAQLQKTYTSLNVKDLEALLAGLGEGSLSLNAVLHRLIPERRAHPVKNVVKNTTKGVAKVVGAPELLCTLAQCCGPQPPDLLVGYVTRGSGVTVHRQGCLNLPDEPERWLACQWTHLVAADGGIQIELEVECHYRIGAVTAITGLISSRLINIVKISTENRSNNSNTMVMHLWIEVADMFAANGLLQLLNNHEDVVRAEIKNSPSPRKGSSPKAE
jgi:GTP pyrophosphokinase